METVGIGALAAQVPAFALVLARITAFITTAPIFGGPYAPMHAKVGLSVALAVAAFPGATARAHAVISADGSFIVLLAQEVLFGLCLGWLIGLLTHGVRMGGELISRYAGFNAAENFDPDADVGSGPFSDLLFVGLVLLFFATDTHHLLIAGIVDSYRAVPLGSPAIGPAAMQLAIDGVQQSVAAACALSFPVLSVVMAVTIVEGIITRAVPQINLLQLSFAVKIFLSVAVTIAGLPVIIAFLHAVLVMIHAIIGPAILALRNA